MNLLKTAQGTLLDVHVKPKSGNFKIEIDELLVFCREALEKGK